MKEIDPSVRSRQVRALYWAAQDQPAAERADWLVSASGGDEQLQAEVAALGAMLETQSAMESIVADAPPTAIAAAVSAAFGHADSSGAGVQIGDRLGPYTLVREVGRGGMGVVYEALEDPPLARTVAIKVVRSGMESPDVVNRFELERLILAGFDHPNIARVFSAGSTPLGKPWFAMEFVRGQTITDYCDHKRLDIHQRLALMVPVCQAVDYANNQNIFHRDIKPHNVLVTEDDQGRPVPKVIDFGIAKATELSGKVRKVVTATEAVMGTQIYWSPEQAGVIRGPTDKRTDVYLLGNLLYELLTGTPRIDPSTLQENALAQVMALLGADPPRPRDRLSTLSRARLSTVAAARQSDAQEIGKLVRREPEWVVMKALQIEPDRRYQSAADLGRDLENWLAGRPIVATPEDWFHQARKFARNHRLAVGIGSAAFFGLLLAAVGLGAGLIRAHNAERISNQQRTIAITRQGEAEEQRALALKERNEADQQRTNAQAVLIYLTDDVLASVMPTRTPDKSLRDALVDKMLRPAVEAIDQKFASQPELRANIQTTLAQLSRQLGRADLALPLAQAALATSQSPRALNEVNAFLAEQEIALDLTLLGRFTEAEPHFHRLVTKAQGPNAERFNIGGTLVDLFKNNAMNEMELEHPAEALVAGRMAYERGRRSHGEDDSQTLDAQNVLVGILQSQGKMDEAVPLAEDELQRASRALGPDHLTTIAAENSLAIVYTREGRLADAERLDRDALKAYLRILGDDHPSTIQQETMLAGLLCDTGRPADAEPLARDAWVRNHRISGSESTVTVSAGTVLASALNRLNRPAEAETVLRELLPMSVQIYGTQSREAIVAADSLARALMGLGRFGDAEMPARKAFAAAHDTLEEQHPLAMDTTLVLCDMLRMTGRATEAEPIARHALEVAVKSWGDKNPITEAVRQEYGTVLVKAGRIDDARAVVAGHSPPPSTQSAEMAAATQSAATMPSR